MEAFITVKKLQKLLASKELSSKEITSYYLENIQKHDGSINAFITVDQEFTLNQAEHADRLIRKGLGTGLTGIPIAHKDIFCTKELKTTCGSKMLENFVPPYDATIIAALNRSGAVILGKTNMDEFAMGSSNETSFFGSVKNPWNQSRVPGGSSGGSAAAVAADFCSAATGTDTGGSIRQPASFCGLTGLKPTYGSISRYGMIAFASSLDQAGPLCRNAEDASILFNNMTGFDPLDSTSVDSGARLKSRSLEDGSLTIGLPKNYFQNYDTDTSLAEIKQELEKLGHRFVDIELPHLRAAIGAYYVIASAEASTNLSRYDGVRFGHRCENPKNIEDLYIRSRTEAFGDEVKRRILTGTYALSVGYFDEYYIKAQKVRRLISQDFTEAFAEVDLILTPTTPSTAFELDSLIADPIKMYQQDLYTVPVNLAGLPAISIPCGFHDRMPLGAQLIAPAFQENLLLDISTQFQEATDFHQQFASAFS
ncbi:Asp-tRNA(Asn)/Glu-tRNA(Gln) amidotransferase subunit GatA [Gammaproteobacteria bacterium]|nr:Asp-tRNA(Asn)/Glu-tRNA(Gln) amidotransferase subunit GatA [Gammaproteobacteria bacterium]